jgi:hypothetical protein
VEGESDFKSDLIGAALIIVLGIVVVVVGVGYRLGTLTNMGAGYVPTVIGTLLIVVGLAIFSAVFLSALGDRSNSWRDCFLLALGMTVAGVAIFSFGLKLTFPLFTWA